MDAFLKPLLSRQFGLFVFAGSMAALIHWGSRIAFNQYMGFRLALVAAYAVGIGTAFLLNKLFVFPDSGRELKGEVQYFVFFNIAAFPLVWGASVFLAGYVLPTAGLTSHPRAIAHAIGISLPLVLNFYLHKFITFRPKELPGDER